MWPSSLPFYDIFGIITYCSIDGLGILGNFILLIAIVIRTPTNLRSYSVILLNSAMIDLIACLCSLSVMTRAIPAGWSLVYVYLGPCSMTSIFVCHFAYSALLHTFAHSLYLIIASFSYRLYVLKRPPPSRNRLFLLCVAVYLPSLFFMCVYTFALDPQPELLGAIMLEKPDFDWSDGCMFAGHASVLKPRVVFAIIFMIGPAVPAMVVIFILRSRVLRFLKQCSISMSARTHEQHARLVKVLSLQSMLPIFFFGGGISYFVCQIGVVCSRFQEHMSIAIWGIMPASAPFITLYYVKPYRLFVLSLVRRKVNVVAPPSLTPPVW